jgi:hypothetical protein
MPSDPFTSFWYWLTGKAVQGSGWASDKAFSGAELAAPSTRAIDHLRSASQHRRELRSLQNLYHQLNNHAPHAQELYNTLCLSAIQSVVSPTADKALRQPAQRLCVALLEYEGLLGMPEITQHRELSISEIWELTATLRRQLKLLESPQTRQLIGELLKDFLQTLIPSQLLNQSAEDEGEAYTFVPLYMQYADPAEAIEAIIPDFSVVLFRPNFMLVSEEPPMKTHKNQCLLNPPTPPDIPCGATNQGTSHGA